jgi:hypothetical protein
MGLLVKGDACSSHRLEDSANISAIRPQKKDDLALTDRE